jgi:hypothetical protein
MRSLAVALLLALALGTSGCRRNRGTEGGTARTDPLGLAEPQGSAEPAPVGTEAEPAAEEPNIENAAAVERFSDEAALGYTPTTVVKSTMARTAPGKRAITLLLGGSDVVQIAERGGSVLVQFPDPGNPDRQVMGWIPSSSLRPVLRSPCPDRQHPVVTGLGSFCATACRDSRNCSADEACVQAGTPTAERGGRITTSLHYCVDR